MALLRDFDKVLLASLILAGCIVSSVQARQDISGVWYDDTGQGAVELAPCGGYICGHIVWLRQPFNINGEPLRDIYNPSPSLKQRSICGLPVIAGVRPQQDGSWDGGRIYDPKVGRTYNVAIVRLDGQRLRVIGYLGARLFGKSFVWHRAGDDIERCEIINSPSRPG